MFSLAASYLHEENTDEGSYKISATVTPVDGLFIKGWYMADSGVTRAIGGANDWQWALAQATKLLTLLTFALHTTTPIQLKATL